MDHHKFIVSNQKKEFIIAYRVNAKIGCPVKTYTFLLDCFLRKSVSSFGLDAVTEVERLVESDVKTAAQWPTILPLC